VTTVNAAPAARDCYAPIMEPGVTSSAQPASPPSSDGRRIPWLALIGPAVLALSTVFAWTIEAFLPPPAASIYATELSVPFLVTTRVFFTRPPTVAQVLVVFAIAASGLILVQAKWADILRRLIGVVTLILAGLFAWRFNQSLESFHTPGLLRTLRLGFYLGVIGAILLVVLPGARGEKAR
jgi:hypothetical protein